MEVQLNKPTEVNGAIVLSKDDFSELASAFSKAMPKIEVANKELGYRHPDRLKKDELNSLRELLDAIESGNKVIQDTYGN